MKLYINAQNKWAGTQADAKALGEPFEMCEVPTDKGGLLAFLNNAATTTDDPVEIPVVPVSLAPLPKTKPKDSLVGRCDLVELKELSTTLRALLFKTWNEMEKQEE